MSLETNTVRRTWVGVSEIEEQGVYVARGYRLAGGYSCWGIREREGCRSWSNRDKDTNTLRALRELSKATERWNLSVALVLGKTGLEGSIDNSQNRPHTPVSWGESVHESALARLDYLAVFRWHVILFCHLNKGASNPVLWSNKASKPYISSRSPLKA